MWSSVCKSVMPLINFGYWPPIESSRMSLSSPCTKCIADGQLTICVCIFYFSWNKCCEAILTAPWVDIFCKSKRPDHHLDHGKVWLLRTPLCCCWNDRQSSVCLLGQATACTGTQWALTRLIQEVHSHRKHSLNSGYRSFLQQPRPPALLQRACSESSPKPPAF